MTQRQIHMQMTQRQIHMQNDLKELVKYTSCLAEEDWQGIHDQQNRNNDIEKYIDQGFESLIKLSGNNNAKTKLTIIDSMRSNFAIARQSLSYVLPIASLMLIALFAMCAALFTLSIAYTIPLVAALFLGLFALNYRKAIAGNKQQDNGGAIVIDYLDAHNRKLLISYNKIYDSRGGYDSSYQHEYDAQREDFKRIYQEHFEFDQKIRNQKNNSRTLLRALLIAAVVAILVPFTVGIIVHAAVPTLIAAAVATAFLALIPLIHGMLHSINVCRKINNGEIAEHLAKVSNFIEKLDNPESYRTTVHTSIDGPEDSVDELSRLKCFSYNSKIESPSSFRDHSTSFAHSPAPSSYD